jgi:NAD(P)-dependent dehydrogenase (short-subunit alcohol dehydrogenase family)
MPLLIVFGYGPGVSHATASRFGREGYTLALVGRDAGRLADGVARFRGEGIDAKAYQCDASDADRVRRTVAEIRDNLGAISAVLWTAFRNGDVGDVLATRAEDVERVFDVGVTGLLTCVQAALDDLKASPGAAILVANGALGEHTSQADGFAKLLGNDGVALENAAKSKLVGILAERLREFDIYVGEITIAGSVAGTATASPTAIEPTTIADTFWSLTHTRETTRVRVTETTLA